VQALADRRFTIEIKAVALVEQEESQKKAAR
jgi:hypothetical protein